MKLFGSLATVAFMCAACSSTAQNHLARPITDTVRPGVVRVMNPGPTAWADTNGWKLVYERTVQPAEGDPGALQNPWSAQLTSDGRLVTLDLQHPAIRLYDKTGKFVRLLGRVGEGPGEYRSPFIALFRDTLIIQDGPPKRASIMTLDGKLVRSFPTTLDQFPPFVDARGRIAIHTSLWGHGPIRQYWVYFTRDGVQQDSLVPPARFIGKEWEFQSAEGPDGVPVPFGAEGVFHMLPDGTAVSGRTDLYEFTVTSTGRDTLRVFGRISPPLVTIPATIRDSAFHERVDRIAAVKAVARESDVPLTYQPWRTMQHDSAGNIWVGAHRDRPEASRFDVFSPGGEFLGSVAAPFAVNAKVAFQGDRLTVIDTDANDLPRIRIFRIDRRGH